MADEVLLTKEGLEKIQAEHDELVSVRRKEVAERIKEAREFGDISENAEYDAALNEQAEMEERIAKLENMIRSAKIIEDNKGAKGKVNVGSKVTVKNQNDGTEKVFQIVGSTEADPFAGLISNVSPVGAGLIGHKTGDVVSIETPGGYVSYEILKTSNK